MPIACSDTFNTLAMPGTDHMQYIPWIQACYVMAANREALQYLPEGADINALTYDQLIAWAANVQAGDAAIAEMSSAPDANPGLLPAGLGDKGGDFNRVFVDTFEQIILGGQDIRTVLDDQKEKRAAVMEETGAPCWAPDAPSEGACSVE